MGNNLNYGNNVADDIATVRHLVGQQSTVELLYGFGFYNAVSREGRDVTTTDNWSEPSYMRGRASRLVRLNPSSDPAFVEQEGLYEGNFERTFLELELLDGSQGVAVPGTHSSIMDIDPEAINGAEARDLGTAYARLDTIRRILAD